MEHTRFVGLDIHKERISIAVAESGRSCAVEYLGEISNDPVAIGKLCDRLERSSDLIRLRSVVRQIVSRARQHLQGFLLRHGRKHGRGTAWRMAYRRWLSTLAFEHPAQQIALQDYVDAVMDAARRLKRAED